MEQAEKSAAEAETQSNGTLGLEEEGRVVQSQLFEGFSQLRVLVRVDGVEPGEDHRLDFFEAGQGVNGGVGVIGDGVAGFCVGNVLDVSDDESDFACLQ